jgi:hypothetical protein
LDKRAPGAPPVGRSSIKIKGEKMKKAIFYIIGVVFLLIIIIPLIAYFTPNSDFTKIIKCYTDYSAFIIAALTMAYVITTTLQYTNMKNQLNMMETSLKLQVQPLPVPSILEFEMEKIRPYLGPEDKFTSVIIMNRVHAKIQLNNNGSGIPMSINIFPTLILEGEIQLPQPHIEPNTVSIITEGKTSNKIGLMFFDDQYLILNHIDKKRELKIVFEILYKNIFGAGFYSKYTFKVGTKREERANVKDSLKFINEELPNFKMKLEKHKALKSIDREEARAIFTEIETIITYRIKNDIIFDIPSEVFECDVSVVNFEEKLSELKTKYNSLVEKYYKKQFEMYTKSEEIKKG